MTQNDNAASARDSDLIAYLDGQLQPQTRAMLEERLARDSSLRVRLEELRAGGRDFGQAFDAVLDAAPAERLSAMLNKEVQQHDHRHAGTRSLPVWAAIAASLAMLVAGLGAGYGLRSLGLPAFLQPPTEQGQIDTEAWEQMLASDLALYTSEGLALIGPEGMPSNAELKAIGAKLNIALSTKRLALPDLTLKQARLLAFRGVPLLQLIYLDPRHGPVAFCIYASAGGGEALETERRADMNLAYWADKSKGYMLIGRAPASQLQSLATILMRRFPPASA